MKDPEIEKIIIPSNIIDIYTRLEVLLGIKLSGHSDTLTESGPLIDQLYRMDEIQTEQQNRNALDKFHTQEMELPIKTLEQIAYNNRPKNQEHMLIVLDKSTHGRHLSQPLQTNNKQFKMALISLIGYNGIFKVTNSNNRFYFKKTITIEEDFIQIFILPSACEIKSLNLEIKRNFLDKGHYTEDDYPFTIKPNFYTLCSIVEIVPQGPIIGFVFDDSIRNLLGFNETILYRKYNLSPNPVDIISFNNNFLENDIAK